MYTVIILYTVYLLLAHLVKVRVPHIFILRRTRTGRAYTYDDALITEVPVSIHGRHVTTSDRAERRVYP